MKDEGPTAKRSPWWMALGWVLSIGILVVAFSLVPVHEVWSAIRTVDLTLMALAVVLIVFGLGFRGWRWGSIFSVRKEVSAFQASRITLIGMAINGVVPGRVGELARVGLAAHRFKTDFVFSLATVFIERLLDAATLLAFLLMSLIIVRPKSTSESVEVFGNSVEYSSFTTSLGYMVGISVVILLGLVLFSRQGVVAFFVRLIRKIPLIPQRQRDWMAEVLEDLNSTFRELWRIGNIVRLGTLSLVIWVPAVFANFFIGLGLEGIDLSLPEAMFVTAAGTAVIALPSAPGGWGVYEAGLFLILKAIGAGEEDSALLGYAFVTHACAYFPLMAMGAVAFLVGNDGESKSVET